MTYLVATITNNDAFPWWGAVAIAIYLIGVAIAIKGVNKRKKWWQKALFVIFWPYFFARIMIALLIAFG